MVKRYSVGVDGTDPNGNLVKYDDYAALEARCAALAAELKRSQIGAGCYKKGMEASNERLVQVAAENAGLKELIEQHANSVAVCPNCSHEEPSETDDIVALYRSMETPSTDAYLAEVRAQGVEMAAKSDQFPMWVQQGLRSFAIGVHQGDEK